MFTCRIRLFIQQTALFARTTPVKRKFWTDVLKQEHAENEKFRALFPDIVASVSKTENLRNLPEIGEFANKFLQYNLTGIKMTRGLMTVTAYKMLEKPENITEESLRLARTLGWCNELIQMCIRFLDDIIYNSETRRDSTCWYRLPDVGMRAVNDSSFLIALIFENLKHNFSDKQYYSKLLDIFNEAILQMTIGQSLDSRTARNTSLFTEKNYNDIARFKTTNCTFKLPVYVSLLLANKSYNAAYKNEEDLLSLMGILISMQNDYADCFGDESESGKAGTDIQEGKCSWLAVQALARGSAAQRAALAASYGSADAARVRDVISLYEQLQLPTIFRKAKHDAYDNIIKRIEAIPEDNVVPPALTQKLFHMAYQNKACDN